MLVYKNMIWWQIIYRFSVWNSQMAASEWMKRKKNRPNHQKKTNLFLIKYIKANEFRQNKKAPSHAHTLTHHTCREHIWINTKAIRKWFFAEHNRINWRIQRVEKKHGMYFLSRSPKEYEIFVISIMIFRKTHNEWACETPKIAQTPPTQ